MSQNQICTCLEQDTSFCRSLQDTNEERSIDKFQYLDFFQFTGKVLLNTLADGEEGPLSVGVAGDGLDGLSAGEAEAGVALVRGLALEAL